MNIRTVNNRNRILLVATLLDNEDVTLGVYPKTTWGKRQANVALSGAQSLADAMREQAEGLASDPEKLAEMAAQAARDAGVDEGLIAMGGVAVGPFGTVEIDGRC